MYIRNLSHMTKMAAMPIYGKNTSKIFFSGTVGPISKKVQVDNDQEMAQLERNSHSINRGVGKN